MSKSVFFKRQSYFFYKTIGLGILFFISMGIGSVLARHQFYASLCLITHNQEQNALQITLKMFSDDLNLALDPCANRVHSSSDSCLVAYLRRHISLDINQKPALWQFVGSEQDNDNTTWCYMEIENCEPIKELSIRQTVLTDLFEKQNNIVNLNLYKNTQSFILNAQNPIVAVKNLN